MEFWRLFDILVLDAGFFLVFASCIILAAYGIFQRSRMALSLSAGLLLPSAFLLSFQPTISGIDELPARLAGFTFWTSIIVSPLFAMLGVWNQSRTLLLVSAALSVPIGLWLFMYPGTRFFLVLPVMHLIGAATARTRLWAIGIVMLVGILSLGAVFLLQISGSF